MGIGDFSVFLSRNHKFKYYDDKKLPHGSNDAKINFTPPTRRIDMKFPEFCRRIKDWKKGEERYFSLIFRVVSPYNAITFTSTVFLP